MRVCMCVYVCRHRLTLLAARATTTRRAVRRSLPGASGSWTGWTCPSSRRRASCATHSWRGWPPGTCERCAKHLCVRVWGILMGGGAMLLPRLAATGRHYVVMARPRPQPRRRFVNGRALRLCAAARWGWRGGRPILVTSVGGGGLASVDGIGKWASSLLHMHSSELVCRVVVGGGQPSLEAHSFYGRVALLSLRYLSHC